MHSVLVLVLILVLQFSISFPAVAGDCYKDPPNNGSYDNCNTCYQTLANAIINTKDNKYKLSVTFFPRNAAPPVQVEISFNSSSNPDCIRKWYWLRGGYYVFLPIQLLVYHSLLFSPSDLRRCSVILELPEKCYDQTTRKNDHMLEVVQRLKGYAESQKSIPKIADNYMGWAVFEGDQEINNDDIYGNISKAIVPAAHWVPPCVFCFILFCIIVLIIVFFTCHDSSTNIFEQLLNNLHQNTDTQATLFALVVVSILMTIYIFIMNLRLYSIFSKNDGRLSIPLYYPKHGYGFNIPIISLRFSSFSVVVTIVATFLFLIWLIGFNFGRISGKMNCLCITSLALYFGSTFLQISCHIPSILMAWSTDPFYASKIAVYYAVYIFLNYTITKYTYILSLKLCKSCKCRCAKAANIVVVIVSVTITLLLVNGVLVTITIFIVYIPVNSSIEESADGVKSLYNGAVLLIGGIIAYNFVWYYLFGSFSFNKAMERAMKDMQIPFNNPSDNSHWQRLTEEGRMVEVMKALISHQTLSRPRYDPLYSALTIVLINARKNTRRIFPPADQVATLSTVLYDTINTALRNVTENDVMKIKTLTDALVQVMNKPNFVLDCPHIDLDMQPTEEMLDVLQNDVQSHIDLENLTVDEEKIKMDLMIVLVPLPLVCALAKVLRNAQNGPRPQQKINPPADQVVSLSAVLYDTIDTAVRNVAGNDDRKIKSLTDALVQIMNKPNLVQDCPHIDLDMPPTKEMLNVLQNDVQSHIDLANLTVDEEKIKLDLMIVLVPLPLVRALAKVLRDAQNGPGPQQKINPTADQVVRLSAVLYDTIDTAVRNVARNDDRIKTLTDALVQVMTFVLYDPCIDLAEKPADKKLTDLRKNVQSQLNAVIGKNPVHLAPDDIKTALEDALIP